MFYFEKKLQEPAYPAAFLLYYACSASKNMI